MKWHWHNARCTVPKAGLALLRAWAAVGWQEVGGPWRSEVGPVFIVYKQAANGREARRHISCQAHWLAEAQGSTRGSGGVPVRARGHSVGALRGRQSPELIRPWASELRANLLCRSRDFQTMGNGRNGLPAEGSGRNSRHFKFYAKGVLGHSIEQTRKTPTRLRLITP